MIARWRAALALARRCDLSTLNELLEISRKHGSGVAGRWLADHCEPSLRRRLTLSLGAQPTDQQVAIAKLGAQGVYEGMMR